MRRRAFITRGLIFVPAIVGLASKARAAVLINPFLHGPGLRDSDTFPYSDGNLTTVSSSKWTQCTIGAPGAVAVVSGQIHNGGNENAALITTWAGSTTLQYSESLYVSGDYGGPTIFNDGASTFYLCDLAAGAVKLYKVVSGSFSILQSGGSVTAGHTYRIRVQTAGTIVISDNGSDIITFPDSSITSGKPGIRCWGNYLDDWVAGDF